MQLDTEECFKSIYSSAQDFKNDQIDIQKFAYSTDVYREWASHLRFLTPFYESDDENLPSPASNISIDENGTQQPESGGERSGMSDSERDTSSLSSGSSGRGEDCGCARWKSRTLEFSPRNKRLRLTEPDECPGCGHYVAVSYCWHGHGSDNTVEDCYEIYTANGARSNKAPSNILKRATKFARFNREHNIWIDQECIDQEDRKDKEHGIQSMHIVYSKARTGLGLLNSRFDSQAQLDALELLIEGAEIASDYMQDVWSVLEVFRNDVWFTRAWILQEYIAAGMTMEILIRHAEGLEKSTCLGSIPGECQITLIEFFSMLSWAEVCVESAKDEVPTSIASGLGETIRQLWIMCPAHVPSMSQPSRITCNAAQALHFLTPRKNERIADRLAILANLCDYDVRIDSYRTEEGQYGFSICALTLALLNGDLSLIYCLPEWPGKATHWSFPYGHPVSPWMVSDSEQYSQMNDNSRAMDRIGFTWSPPACTALSGLQFVEEETPPLRLSHTVILESGILTKGWLWKIDYFFDVTSIRDRFRNSWECNATKEAGQNDPMLNASVIWMLIRKLFDSGLRTIADSVYCGTKSALLRSWGSKYPAIQELLWTQKPTTPDTILKILDQETKQFILHEPPYIENEEDFQVLFPDTSMPQYGDVQGDWLVHLIMKTGKIPCGRLINASGQTLSCNCTYTAVFETSPYHSAYAFTPSTTYDDMSRPSVHTNRLRYWLIDPIIPQQVQDGPVKIPVINGCNYIRGYYEIPNDESPQELVFA